MNYHTMTLADIATAQPESTRVFRRFDLDFCCGGNHTLDEATDGKPVSTSDVVTELEKVASKPDKRPSELSTPELVEYIIHRYHERHRQLLPELIRLATTVERVHTMHPDCPFGVTTHLNTMLAAMADHMEKEETSLFPALVNGNGEECASLIDALEKEHAEHGEKLEQLKAYAPSAEMPDGACPTWVALIKGIHQLIDELMEHVHVENNILFPRFGKQ